MADEVEHQPRATTASIDRRVERLEVAQADTDRKVDALVLEVGFIKRLMELKFGGLEQSIATQGAKLDNFILKIDALITKSQEQQADLDSTPLGRSVNKRLIELEAQAEKTQRVIDGASGVGYVITRYVLPTAGVVIGIVALLLPLALHGIVP